ncbi:MAG: CcoQ/FixQ family Cbb3-type cytochrome c oxidase assembly chaperone [Campylobacteraceae bacterium]|nr:CcoQ/FixQ family Cbb3-type cytochrome c oxidase assembly chaperone [Campylobacteraceae bacterium]
MTHQELVDLQGYVKFFLLLVVCIVFYSYAYSIYKRDKSGERDYEKYSNLVHDDSIHSQPLENRELKQEKKES